MSPTPVFDGTQRSAATSPAPASSETQLPVETNVAPLSVEVQLPAETNVAPVSSLPGEYKDANAVVAIPDVEPGRRSVSNRMSVSDAPRRNHFQGDSYRLHLMSASGPPVTLQERYERQEVANRLALAPVVYNLLVFVEAPPPSLHLATHEVLPQTWFP